MALNSDPPQDTYSFPPLTDADYLTSSRIGSRRPSRTASKSPMITAPGPAFGEHSDYKDEKLSIDPRRFTPTLHANLVSEILSLRREVEQKNNLVIDLEEHMVQVKEENTKLHQVVSESSHEKRSLKRQVDALENGTLAAIEEIAKERDTAKEAVAEIKSKLEFSQKKVRAQEQDQERIQTFWQQDQEKWDTERRTLERQVHVVETRLKTVLAEVAAQANAPTSRRSIDGPHPWSRDRPSSRTSGRRSAASVHRESLINPAEGKTLADELDFHEHSDADSDDYQSTDALPEELEVQRSISALSNRQSIKARKLLGLHIDPAEEQSTININGQTPTSEVIIPKRTSLQYADSSTQYSPPPSPALTETNQRLSTITEFDGDSLLDFQISRPVSGDFDKLPKSNTMVSSGCQTIEIPLSPPVTPTRSRSESIIDMHKTVMTTSSTQTLEVPILHHPTTSTTTASTKKPTMTTSFTQTSENLFTATMHTIKNIPLITIDSAKSEMDSTTPSNMKNASTMSYIVGSVKSTAVQTDNIRTDERLTRLPAHLYPAIIRPVSLLPSPVSSPAPQIVEKTQTRASDAPTSRPKIYIPQQKSTVSKSVKRRSLEKSNESKIHSDSEYSDDSFLKKKPIKKVLSKIQNTWQAVDSPIEPNDITDTEELPHKLPDLELGSGLDLRNRQSGAEATQRKNKLHPGQTKAGQFKGTPTDNKANIGRTRSPSEPIRPDRTSGLPFPVPDRSSSRKFPWLTDDGNESPSPGLGKNGKTRAPKKRSKVRKVKSEIDNLNARDRLRSPSPQPFDVFTESLAQIPPPLPDNEITTPRSTTFRQQSAHHSIPSQADSVRSDQTTVVDSIAQTMIGEWMFKYVRRRKSFGLADEQPSGDNSVIGGIRHQRWVWVAPYERAVMWSSKQPTSGTALMGKNGRKLVISSVLDVRDDSPMPKGAPSSSHFGRSILILTPQRALKFTATSIDRHYVWMNALSFLSQGPVDFADIIEHTPIPATSTAQNSRRGSLLGHQAAQPSVDGSLHRSKIHDSIRIAKGRDRPSPGQRALTNPVVSALQAPQDVDANVDDAGAEAPVVPRTSADKRSRSNTASRSQNHSMRSFTSSNKPSLHSLKSRVESPVDGQPRSSLRLWPGKPQRAASDNSSSHHSQRIPSMRSSNVEPENVSEAVGTMRMSAFIHDRMGNNSVTDSRHGDSSRVSSSLRPASTKDDEDRRTRENMATDGTQALPSLRQWKQMHPINTANSSSEQPRRSPVLGTNNPFEGF